MTAIMQGCRSACWAVPGHAANGTNIISQYNHIWNTIQGVTADGGTLYYNVGAGKGSGTGDKILNNLVHDTTDSSIIDHGVHGSGYGGEGIYLDISSAGVDVENNVVYRMADIGAFMNSGPVPNLPPSTFHNNIFALRQKGDVQPGDSVAGRLHQSDHASQCH